MCLSGEALDGDQSTTYTKQKLDYSIEFDLEIVNAYSETQKREGYRYWKYRKEIGSFPSY